MYFGITSDSWWETRVSDVLHKLPIRKMHDEFCVKSYGSDVHGIFIVLTCDHPEYSYRQRIRFVKKEKILYADIMLDFDFFMNATQEQREQKAFHQILEELPIIISKYKFQDFNTKEFIKDLSLFLIDRDMKD